MSAVAIQFTFASPFLSKAATVYQLLNLNWKRFPLPKTLWSPAHRDTLDLLTSLSILLLAGSMAQPQLPGTLLLSAAPKIISEDDVPIHVGSVAGCTLSCWQQWPRGQQE